MGVDCSVWVSGGQADPNVSLRSKVLLKFDISIPDSGHERMGRFEA